MATDNRKIISISRYNGRRNIDWKYQFNDILK